MIGTADSALFFVENYFSRLLKLAGTLILGLLGASNAMALKSMGFASLGCSINRMVI